MREPAAFKVDSLVVLIGATRMTEKGRSMHVLHLYLVANMNILISGQSGSYEHFCLIWLLRRYM